MAAKTGKAPNKKMSLGLRMKAWWEGYDPDEIQKRIQDRAPASDTVDEPTVEQKKATAVETVDSWDDETVDIAQFIWGKGFCGPGGPDFIVALSKLLALSPEMSMLQIGAGLGGPARVLADKFGVWMSGYESSKTLVDKGNKLSKINGLEKKVVLEHYNPEAVESFGRKFDRALSKEALFTIRDKNNIIANIEDKLKPGGLFLMTEYVLGSDASIGKDSYKEWVMGERQKPYPVLAEELIATIKANHMQVRVSEDISMQYVEMINQAWAGADEVAAKLARDDDGTKKIQILMREAEFWTRRKKMLQSGDIKLWRIVANKKSGGPSMMSDW